MTRHCRRPQSTCPPSILREESDTRTRKLMLFFILRVSSLAELMGRHGEVIVFPYNVAWVRKRPLDTNLFLGTVPAPFNIFCPRSLCLPERWQELIRMAVALPSFRVLVANSSYLSDWIFGVLALVFPP